MKLYLAGHHTFGNRGCEALVRSTFDIIQRRFPGAEFLVPSTDLARDARQWPGLEERHGRLVAALDNVPVIRWWDRVARRVPGVRPLWEPRYTPPRVLLDPILESDVVLMIGGDVISLDYGPGSLFFWSGLMDAAKRAGKTTMLFAASVGPFTADPVIERFMVNHLRRYSAITVREASSAAYLQKLGLQNAVLTADPAFCLEPQAAELGAPYNGGRDVLAFNVSPLVNDSWLRAGNAGTLIGECAAFIRRVVEETGLAVALLPHVDPLDGIGENSDTGFMRMLFAETGDAGGRIAMVRSGLNAAETKFVISRSRFLIAARTHATIAGWSQGVPTASIAYSIKARGLNQDLFDTLDYVIETPKVSRHTLWQSLQRLVEREVGIHALLADRIPLWREKAMRNGEVLAGVLR